MEDVKITNEAVKTKPKFLSDKQMLVVKKKDLEQLKKVLGPELAGYELFGVAVKEVCGLRGVQYDG